MNTIRSIFIGFLLLGLVLVPYCDASTYHRISKTHRLNLDNGDIDQERKKVSVDDALQYSPETGLHIVPWDLTFDPSSTFIFQGTPKTNVQNSQKTGSSWVLYLDFIKKFENWGVAFFELKTGLGDALAKSLSLFNDVNYNSDPLGGNVKAEAYWYKQYLFDKQVSVLCGKILSRGLFAQNEYAGDDDTQFIGYIFNESPAIEWPAGKGFTINSEVCLKSMEFLEFSFNYWEGDADWERVFEGGIYTMQVNIKPSKLFGMDRSQWDGNYRFYSWFNTRFHTKLVFAGSVPSPDVKEYNYGFGLSFDQMITDIYGVFVRCGFQRPDLIPAGGGTSIGFSWSAGAQMKGEYWGREKDVFGLGLGQVVPSKEYVKDGNSGRTEGHLEAYYSFAITDFLFISPDLQFVWNPDGLPVKDIDPVFVYGLRVHADF